MGGTKHQERRGLLVGLVSAVATLLLAALAWLRRIPDQDHDLHGRTVLITGGNSGIGKATAIGLARCGARVVITSRDRDAGEAAVRDIRAATGNEAIEAMHLDLADLASVRRFAAEAREQFDRLDVLINNAGAIHGERRRTADGFEMTIGVNHLGPFLLTLLLLPLLLDSTPSRIVNVASTAHRAGEIDLDDLHHDQDPYDALSVYADSKLANVLFTRELARRLEGTGVVVHACHPGTVSSRFGQDGDAGWLFGWLYRIASPVMLTPEHGAIAPIHLAASDEAGRSTGAYWYRRMKVVPSPAARDAKLARGLWEASAAEVGLREPAVPGARSSA